MRSQGFARLSAAVLRQALLDMRSLKHGDATAAWVRDRSSALGSFEWYAQLAGLEAGRLRQQIFRRAYGR